MEIPFYQPKNEVLKKYIKGYYFISDPAVSAPVRYWTFPNNYCILSVYYNAALVVEDRRITTVPVAAEQLTASLVSRYIHPIEVCFTSPINEVSIYFNPLGINHFVPTDKLFTGRHLVNYMPFADFGAAMKSILEEQDRKQQVDQLEAYWLSKWQAKDLSLMEQLLAEVESGKTIGEMALQYRLTRQYINRLFVKHIGKPPAEYRKIHRFRNALTGEKNSRNLTDLSYDNLFFDQAHFIRNFRELTETKPSAFFRQVDTTVENVWLFR